MPIQVSLFVRKKPLDKLEIRIDLNAEPRCGVVADGLIDNHRQQQYAESIKQCGISVIVKRH